MLTYDEFEETISKREVSVHFRRVLEIDIQQASLLFQMLLEKKNKGELTVDEFIEGCKRMTTTAKVVDFEHFSDRLAKKQCELEDKIDAQMCMLARITKSSADDQ